MLILFSINLVKLTLSLVIHLCFVFLFDVNHLNLAQIWHCLLFVGIQDQKGKKGLLLLVSTTQPIVSTHLDVV